ncbi:MAG: phosphoglucosamine mutase [Clostridiales bacterium]|nr:phosphoglucosamine mutase [Clostridiales bacterium]
MSRLFGTDGVRGVANSELTCELALKLGRATALVLMERAKKSPKVLIGMDTRISSDMLAASIAAGFCSMGVDVMQLGVVPTPAVAYLVKEYKCDAGIMISASHNSFEYNGIKIFQADGYKLPDELEENIEKLILEDKALNPSIIGEDVGRVTYSQTAYFDYVSHIQSSVDISFEGVKVALDCANGAAFVSAPELFMRLGARCSLLGCRPDGININKGSGSTDLEALSRFVAANDCTVGFAFDGDADRLLAVDENGELVDGDKIIAICAQGLKESGKLRGNTAVVTVMSNMGFFKFCDDNDIKYETTQVGDRYVLERMVEKGYSIGGEQSGHVIFHDYATTGDGQLTALKLLEVIIKSGKSLSELAAQVPLYPQVLKNVSVSRIGKIRFDSDEEIKKAIVKAEAELGDQGRVLVRVSGTEPLVRVMLEGKDEKLIEKLACEIAQVINERLI